MTRPHRFRGKSNCRSQRQSDGNRRSGVFRSRDDAYRRERHLQVSTNLRARPVQDHWTVQPSGFLDGRDSLGTVNGTTYPVVLGQRSILRHRFLPRGGSRSPRTINFRRAPERRRGGVSSGQTATIGLLAEQQRRRSPKSQRWAETPRSSASLAGNHISRICTEPTAGATT